MAKKKNTIPSEFDDILGNIYGNGEVGGSVTNIDTLDTQIPLVEDDDITNEPYHSKDFKFCHKCGTKLDKDDIFCCNCGTKLKVEVICDSCGAKLKEGDVFCKKCGNKLK